MVSSKTKFNCSCPRVVHMYILKHRTIFLTSLAHVKLVYTHSKRNFCLLFFISAKTTLAKCQLRFPPLSGFHRIICMLLARKSATKGQQDGAESRQKWWKRTNAFEKRRQRQTAQTGCVTHVTKMNNEPNEYKCTSIIIIIICKGEHSCRLNVAGNLKYHSSEEMICCKTNRKCQADSREAKNGPLFLLICSLFAISLLWWRKVPAWNVRRKSENARWFCNSHRWRMNRKKNENNRRNEDLDYYQTMERILWEFILLHRFVARSKNYPVSSAHCPDL